MYIEVIAALTSAGTTNISIEGPGASFTIVNGVTDASFSSGVVASNQIIVDDQTTYFRSAATGAPYIAISNAALTAGKLYVYIEYVQSIA